MFLSACVPTSPKSNRKSSSTGSTGNTETPENSGAIDFGGKRLYWFASGQEVEGTVTINSDIQEVVYLRGEAIHTYLGLTVAMLVILIKLIA